MFVFCSVCTSVYLAVIIICLGNNHVTDANIYTDLNLFYADNKHNNDVICCEL